jgi:hypothetical protein
MKIFFGTRSKRAVCVAAVVVLFISALAINAGFVQGKPVLAAGTTPIVGTTVTFTPIHGGSSTTATTGANGSFTSSILQVGRYTLTISPSVAYTVSIANKTAVPSPFQVWANFNQMKGLLVGGMNATPGATGPINFMSNGSLTLSLSFSGTVSGTLTK